MSAPPITTSASGDGYRVVLFGPPGAGKTALLAVLGMTQEQQLQGRLTDVTQGLSELKAAVGQPSPDGPVAFPVIFQPFPNGRAAQPGASAVLIDCSGTAAAELLANPWQPREHVPGEGLAGEVLRADVLVLPLDASLTAEQLDAYFESFGIFLRALEVRRGHRLEAAGLPVFLVLTKCDLLAKSGDTPADWMEHIEERKREVNERFHIYLARETAGQAPPAFGGLDVHCWATAAGRPAFDSAPRSKESYGVAELFRQCLQEAAAYRRRQRKAGRRLTWTVGGVAATAALMAGLTAVQFFSGTRVKSDLELKVENIRFSDRATPAERLRAPAVELGRRAERLQKLHDDPGFNALPGADQDFVNDRLTELRDYLDLLKAIPPPRVLMELRSLEALRKRRDDLKQLGVPDEWSDTDAGQKYRERLTDLDALEDAVLAAEARFRTETDRAGTLLGFEGNRLPGRSWLDEARQLLTGDSKPPVTPADRIPGSTSLTYGTVLAFEDVTNDRLSWEKRRSQLAGVRNLIAALGLAGPGVEPPPVLDFPERFTLDMARERAALLKKHYPKFAVDFSLEPLPLNVRQQVVREARHFYENLLRPVRELVAKEVGSPEDWGRVRRLLRSPRDLEDWRLLAKAVTPLLGGLPRDPVQELENFLQPGTAFPIRPTKLVLEVPDNSAPRVKPPATAVLTIEYTPKTGDSATATFTLDNTRTETDTANRMTRYVFTRQSGREILYEPGGKLTATVPARDGRVLTWENPKASDVYQIERLLLAPVLHRERQPVSDGTVEEGVRLTSEPTDGFPRWPELLQKPGR
jgi:hypothetical protein